MLGLKEGLLLHGTQMLYSFSHGRELLLEGEKGTGIGSSFTSPN